MATVVIPFNGSMEETMATYYGIVGTSPSPAPSLSQYQALLLNAIQTQQMMKEKIEAMESQISILMNNIP